jgi:hypothetical protein
MIYNLFLNSRETDPLTNYHSAVSANDRGQRVYAVDWSFLNDDKKYEVYTRFSSRSGDFTANNLCFLTANIGLRSTTASGSSLVTKNGNNVLGVLKVRMASTVLNDFQLSSLASDNQPLSILGRPRDNFLEIRILDNTGAQFNLTTDYILILSFKEVN